MMFFTIFYSSFCVAQKEDIYALYSGIIWSDGWKKFSVMFVQSDSVITNGMYSVIDEDVYVGYLNDMAVMKDGTFIMRWNDQYGSGEMEFFQMKDQSIMGTWKENSELHTYPILIYPSQNRKPSKQEFFSNLDLY